MRRSIPMAVALAAALAGCAAFPLARRTPAGDATTAAALAPEERALGHFLRGEVARRHGDLERAWREFEEAARLDPKRPRLQLRLAELAIRRGDLERAERAARRAAELDPESFRSHYLLAGILAGRGDEDGAARIYERLVAAHPGAPEPYLFLAAIYGKRGDRERERRVLEKLVRSNPGSVLGHFYLGRLYAAQGRLERAEENFRQALRRNPRAAPVMADLGLIEELLGRPARASGLYQRVLALEPENELARKRLAALLTGQRDREAALAEIRSLERVGSDPTETRIKIALIQLERGNYDEAAIELNLARGARPDDPRVRYYLGILLSETGEVARAREQLLGVPESSPLFADARLQLAYLAQREGDLDEAVSYAEAALRARPGSTATLELLVVLERERHRYARAIELARRLVAADPRNDRSHFTLGALLDENGDRPAALEEMRKAIELNPRNAAALNYLGYSLAEEGRDLDEAEQLILRALAIDPNDGFYVDSLGWVYYQQGRYEKAIEQLERAVELTGDDPTINEHLADAYRRVGHELDALRLYREALARTEDEEQRSRIERKMRAVEQARQHDGRRL